MQSLYLNVKDRVSVENNAVLILYILCKTLLVVKLDLCKSVKNVLVILEYSKFRKLSSILEEAVAYLLAKKICQTLVRLIKPSSVCDTVCNVLELCWCVKILVLECFLLDDLRVYLCNAVYAVASVYAKCSHFHLVVLNDRHM